MLKKLGAILIVIFIIALFSMTVFAGYPDDYENLGSYAPASVQNIVSKEDIAREKFWSEYYNALKDGKALDNDLSIITLKNPGKPNSSGYEKNCFITGESVYKDMVVSVARLNRGKGEYEIIQTTDGDTSWEVDGGVFCKKIFLLDGVNNLMLISYRKSEMEAGKIQFNSFTIKLLEETIADKAVKNTINIGPGSQNKVEFRVDTGKVEFKVDMNKEKSAIDMFGGKSK